MKRKYTTADIEAAPTPSLKAFRAASDAILRDIKNGVANRMKRYSNKRKLKLEIYLSPVENVQNTALIALHSYFEMLFSEGLMPVDVEEWETLTRKAMDAQVTAMRDTLMQEANSNADLMQAMMNQQSHLSSEELH